jgi:GNAT superfamily N-acetyltransferase
VEQSTNELDLALTHLGYSARTEYGLIRPAAQHTCRVELVPICTDADWERKRSLHALNEHGPDGFALDPAKWVGFERAKQDAGYHALHLVVQAGVAVGSVGFHVSGSLLRIKNLVVASAHRRRGVGAATLDAACNLAHSRGLAAVGVFAMLGEPGEALYRRNGFTDIVNQVGWDREFTNRLPPRLAHRRSLAYS